MKTTKNCPFCGCNATQILTPTTEPNASSHEKGKQVECINCAARGPSGMATKKDAIKAWDKGEKV